MLFLFLVLCNDAVLVQAVTDALHSKYEQHYGPPM
jgi:hypothetical protein